MNYLKLATQLSCISRDISASLQWLWTGVSRKLSRGMYLGFWLFLYWSTLCCGRGKGENFTCKMLSLCGAKCKARVCELLRSLHSNLESVCSLVLCFRRSSLIVFKYCELFTFWESLFQQLDATILEESCHTARSRRKLYCDEKWTVRYSRKRNFFKIGLHKSLIAELKEHKLAVSI